jgi:hypothetical protein
MNTRFPKTREALTKEWELCSPLELGWSEDGDTLDELHLRSNDTFNKETCYYFNKSEDLYQKVNGSDTIDPRRGYWIRKSTSETVSTSDLVSLTAFFTQLTHYDQTMKTANGFLYNLDGDKYIVTTAHLIFDTPQSQEPQMASMVKCRREELELYCYSRYYDVAIYYVGENSKFDDVTSFNTYSLSIPEHVRVNYLDPHTSNTIKVSSKYFNIVQAPIELGAVGHKLIKGASGSAVTDIRGTLVGMVSSYGDAYDNMSLCIPAATIHRIIDNYDDENKHPSLNFDLTNNIYPGLVSQPLQPGHLEALPDTITGGELVTVSTNSDLRPFDIVTHVEIDNDWVPVGRKTNLSSQILDNHWVKDKFNLKVQKCNQQWRNAFGYLPRKILGKNISNFKLRPIRYLDYDVSRDGEELTIESDIPFSGDVIYPGMSVKVILDSKTNPEEFYYTIKTVNIDEDDKRVTLQGNIVDLEITKLRIYLLSGSYYLNTATIEESQLNLTQQIFGSLFTDLKILPPNDYQIQTIRQDEYLSLVVIHLVRHWSFLVLTQIITLPVGYQQIIWAKESNRLTNMIFDKIFKDKISNFTNLSEPTLEKLKNQLKNIHAYIFQKSLSLIFLKINEFVNYQVTMFTAIFLQSWNKNVQKKLNVLSGVFLKGLTIEDVRTNLLGNLNINIEKMNEIPTNLISEDGVLFDSEGTMRENLLEGNTNYNIDGYSREHRHMKSRTDQINTSPQDSDHITRELELVYKELGKLTADSFNDDSSYYFNSFGIMKSFWDHASLTLGGIIGAISQSSNIYEETEIEINTDTMPLELDTWGWRRLLQNSESHS